MAWFLTELLLLPELFFDDLVLLPELPLYDVLLENLEAAFLFEVAVIASKSFSMYFN